MLMFLNMPELLCIFCIRVRKYHLYQKEYEEISPVYLLLAFMNSGGNTEVLKNV